MYAAKAQVALGCRVLEEHYDAAVGYIPQLHPAEFRLYISLVIPDVRGKGCFPYTGLNLLPQLGKGLGMI